MDIFNSDILEVYGDIIKSNKLSYEEELELFKKKSHGDMKARELLIYSNMYIVLNVIKNCEECNIPCEDLFEEGLKVLIECVDKFDYTRNKRFIYYASYMVMGSINHYINNNCLVIKIPSYLKTYQKKADEIINRNCNNGITDINVNDIANELGIHPNEIEFCLNLPSTVSLNDIDIEDSELEKYFIGDDGDFSIELENKELNRILNYYLNNCLKEKNSNLIKFRYGLRDGEECLFFGVRYLDDAGNKFGYKSREGVRKCENKGLKKIKRIMLKDYSKKKLKEIFGVDVNED